ncbi:MAG: glycosyltransferase, partial [Lachnospiraceae bacterium]|nr:glycosyltransferase [Lachnospiraceae bacterium]
MKTFSLIIPVYRPDERFAELMRRVALQTVLPERILLVETVSREGSKCLEKAVCEFERLERKRSSRTGRITCMRTTPEEFDHGGTRDMAAAGCTSDLLVFMTMDALPADRRLFEYLTAPFSDEQVACAYGRQLPDPSAGICERFTRQFNYPDQSIKKTKDDLGTLGIKTFFCSNVCAAYRRNTYLELGGFEKRTIFNEDM